MDRAPPHTALRGSTVDQLAVVRTLRCVASISSVNTGTAAASAESRAGVTGIDKRPATGAVQVTDPGPRSSARGGLAGDAVCDTDDHGGSDQAVYAYALEDLIDWSQRLERPLSPGAFGENLTTRGIDVTGTRIGTRWRVGDTLLLEVSTPRIPCRTFADWLGERGWVKTFTAHDVPGTYLRVIEPGPVQVGDRCRVSYVPDHEVTVGFAFRALTTQRELLPELAHVDALPRADRERARHAAAEAAE